MRRQLAVGRSSHMKSHARTVNEYLASLPADRRAVVAAVRNLIRKNLRQGFEEGIQYGMIGYFVPHRLYPAGYHCDPQQPLPFAGIASQKHYLSLYLFCGYVNEAEEAWFRKAWAKTGKKLNMGKSCVRFKRLDDLATDVVAAAIRRITVKKFVAAYGQARAKKPSGQRTPTRRTKPPRAKSVR